MRLSLQRFHRLALNRFTQSVLQGARLRHHQRLVAERTLDGLNVLADLFDLALDHGLFKLALKVGRRAPQLSGIEAEGAHQLGQLLRTHHDDRHNGDH